MHYAKEVKLIQFEVFFIEMVFEALEQNEDINRLGVGRNQIIHVSSPVLLKDATVESLLFLSMIVLSTLA